MKDINRGRLIMTRWRLESLACLVDSRFLKEEIRIAVKEIAEVLDEEGWNEDAETD